MNAKLTLRMDESLIASAKDYAAAHGCSVSQMVANYFAALGQSTAGAPRTKASHDPLPTDLVAHQTEGLGPVTRSLLGILKAEPGQPQVSEDDYHVYLERKYLDDAANNTNGSPA